MHLPESMYFHFVIFISQSPAPRQVPQDMHTRARNLPPLRSIHVHTRACMHVHARMVNAAHAAHARTRRMRLPSDVGGGGLQPLSVAPTDSSIASAWPKKAAMPACASSGAAYLRAWPRRSTHSHIRACVRATVVCGTWPGTPPSTARRQLCGDFA